MKRIRIQPDHDPMNPREDCDNADVMFCKHGRYTLGDEDAEDPMREVSYIDIGGYELESGDEAPRANFDEVLEMLEEHADEASSDAEDMHAEGVPSSEVEREEAAVDATRAADAFEFLNTIGRTGDWETKHVLREGIALYRALFLYDHGGITISAGSFSCPWDSGQVGWQYVTEESLAAEWNGDEALATKYMDATLETYDDYITGNVYGFEIEEAKPFTKVYTDGEEIEDEDWEHEDSCWGFYGYDTATNGMQEHVDKELHAALAEAADTIGEWVTC